MKCCAGIVLYQPDINQLKKNIKSISKQVECIYLADNGSTNIDKIEELVSSLNHIILIKNQENLGIAAALNQLCKAAIQDGYAWIMTLDHDTCIPDGTIEKMAEIAKEDTGIICPAVKYEGWSNQPEQESITEEITACMTSASLTNLDAWKKVGGFREDYFIDFVDNEFCMKLRINQYRIIRTNACVMNHHLGETRNRKLLGFIPVTYVYHKPWRYYYMIRNNIAFNREYKKNLNIWKEKIKLLYIIGISWLLTEEKKDTARYIRKGISDAKKGIMGKANI